MIYRQTKSPAQWFINHHQ